MKRLVLILALALAACPLFAQQTMFPPVRGMKHMVGAANNQEVEAGFRTQPCASGCTLPPPN